jgi:hypothetical protein
MTDADLIWRSKSDEELAEAAAALGDYTEEGESLIRAELRRRGLAEPPPPLGRCARCGRSIHVSDPGDECAQCGEPLSADVRSALSAADPNRRGASSDHRDDLITVATFPNMIEASLAKSALEAAGIEAVVPGEDLGATRVRLGAGPWGSLSVRLADYERARSVLQEADDK